MTTEAQPTMHRLRPYLGAVTVLVSVVDEEQRESGLIVPINSDSDGKTRRGVILHVSDDLAGGPLSPGTVVYFRRGWRIVDVLVVEEESIMAYEGGES